jgi:hypothetical protein
MMNVKYGHKNKGIKNEVAELLLQLHENHYEIKFTSYWFYLGLHKGSEMRAGWEAIGTNANNIRLKETLEESLALVRQQLEHKNKMAELKQERLRLQEIHNWKAPIMEWINGKYYLREYTFYASNSNKANEYARGAGLGTPSRIKK